MLIFHEYFNIIWQKEQIYDPCQEKKNTSTLSYHILQWFL